MTNKFKEKQILAEILSDLYNSLEGKENDVRTEYKVVGQKQEKNWRTDELVWEDEEKTIPKMVPDWGRVDKTEDEYTEEDMLRLKVLQYVKTQLEKML